MSGWKRFLRGPATSAPPVSVPEIDPSVSTKPDIIPGTYKVTTDAQELVQSDSLASTPSPPLVTAVSTPVASSLAATATATIAAAAGSNVDYSPIVSPSLTVAMSLFCAVCFILCLKGLSNPTTATRGNILGVVGMFIAVVFAFQETPGFGGPNSLFGLVDLRYLLWWLCAFGIAAVVGGYIGITVNMINLPQVIASFHSAVGMAATLVGIANFFASKDDPNAVAGVQRVETFLAIQIGAVTFVGSVLAALKLADVVRGQLSWPAVVRHTLNSAMFLFIVACGVYYVISTDWWRMLYALSAATLVCLVLGHNLVSAIGGADMPVVVSLLNSYSGWTTSASGLMLGNYLLIIAGALIGSSGAILSYVMCKGMNRSFISVMAGGFGSDTGGAPRAAAGDREQTVQETSPEKLAFDLLSSKRVVIVPGYGMAVARCQNDLGLVAATLRKKGVLVNFAVHPVAGRMPGHMNVLLAEADVPYEIVKEMDEVNPKLLNDDAENRQNVADVCLVVGANDIVNPLSQEPGNSISGMPTIRAWLAKKCIVSKRSLATGYANIDNPLFFKPNTEMLFGNAAKMIRELAAAVEKTAADMTEKKQNENAQRGDGYVALEDEEEDGGCTAACCPKVKPPPKPRVPTLLNIAVLRECDRPVPAEPCAAASKLVAVAPTFVEKLRDLGFGVLVESGAGKAAGFFDEVYEEAGATVVQDRNELIRRGQVIIKVTRPATEEVKIMTKGQYLVSYLWPRQCPDLLKALAQQGVSALALDNLPRISRAQKIDTRSSMANLAGYRAVIECFAKLPRMSKAATTAAGSFPPAKVFIIGAGVAGLQAIATAKGLGAQVFCNDTRAVTKEQVESCGGKFVAVDFHETGEGAGGYAKEMSAGFLRAQKRVYSKVIKDMDVVICTAMIPGKPSPKLVDSEMVRSMRAGSVVLDMAAEMGDLKAGWGGNCQLTKKGTTYTDAKSGVIIVGETDLTDRLPAQASELWSMNVINLFQEIGGAEKLQRIGELIEDDEVCHDLLVTHDNRVLFQEAPPPQPARLPSIQKLKSKPVVGPESMPGSPTPFTEDANPFAQTVAERDEELQRKKEEMAKFLDQVYFVLSLAASLVLCVAMGEGMAARETRQLLVFVLAVVIGYHVVWQVTPSLHTPLMSVTNALSGVIVVGSMLEMDPYKPFSLGSGLAAAATTLASFNICAGFYLTGRMLKMFLRGTGN
uniref:proton-translocating NAD(P)(+) transhydrogenase n=1 Tax=Chromera velia CCMP2878 TaxID=1169474 RepID=A0A0G4HAS9_9ALVE|eukprot:Cvel_6129.t1-p1 / transcript=Cvel_6129.t1 / gene=Cvel_6129 / organism=Chromera_velia_CCMP2878 / gene_product=NAD(P) transhydrogenase subunit beta, putative / transcript_product=NAD(P) transhydrogenase subunit beta, putative / location=Cvel_scaffold296:21538-29718(+) / protein_length=1205 / sequence_SO=supercontig / SO=protein_coding / is_pseudo=false